MGTEMKRPTRRPILTMGTGANSIPLRAGWQDALPLMLVQLTDHWPHLNQIQQNRLLLEFETMAAQADAFAAGETRMGDKGETGPAPAPVQGDDGSKLPKETQELWVIRTFRDIPTAYWSSGYGWLLSLDKASKYADKEAAEATITSKCLPDCKSVQIKNITSDGPQVETEERGGWVIYEPEEGMYLSREPNEKNFGWVNKASALKFYFRTKREAEDFISNEDLSKDAVVLKYGPLPTTKTK